MLHIALHFVVPLLVALALYRREWRPVLLVLIATMLVDVDHLLANPIYDPERCSIGFHPLHRLPAIVLYSALFALPLGLPRKVTASHERSARLAHLIGLGLVVHMGLDWVDCLS